MTIQPADETMAAPAAPPGMDFSLPPRLASVGDPATGLVAARIDGFIGAGPVTVSRGDAAPAMLLLSRASRFEVAGAVAGQRFAVRGSGERVTWLPGGLAGEAVVPAAMQKLALFAPPSLIAVDGMPPPPLVYAADERLRQLVRMLAGEILQPGFASDLLNDGLLRAVAAMLLRPGQPLAPTEDRVHLTASRLRRVFDHIEAHLAAPLTLGELAATAGLSPFHFSRVFRRATGETPVQYLRQRRLEQARHLLLSSDLPVEAIGQACGFANPAHFSRSFAALTGVSPGRFRRQVRR